MGWVQRSLLWTFEEHEHIEEYVFSGAPAGKFDPLTLGLGASLSNGNATLSGGQGKSTGQVYGAGGATGPGFATEFTIDVGHSSQKIVVSGVPSGTGFFYDRYGNVFPYSSNGPSYTTGDKIGLLVYLYGATPYAAVFKNGVLVYCNYIHYYATAPYVFAVAMSGGQVSVESSVSSMTYGAIYSGFVVPSAPNGPASPVTSWPQ